MNISLPRTLQEWLEAQVGAGVHDSIDDDPTQVMRRLTACEQAKPEGTAAIVEMSAEKADGDAAMRHRRGFHALPERLLSLPESGVERPLLGPEARIGTGVPPIVGHDRCLADNVILRSAGGRHDVARQPMPG